MILNILLAIVMVLSTFGIVSFAEETETETAPAQTEYYAKQEQQATAEQPKPPQALLRPLLRLSTPTVIPREIM